MDTLYTFLDNTSHYKSKSVHFGGIMNSATKHMKAPYHILRIFSTYSKDRPGRYFRGSKTSTPPGVPMHVYQDIPLHIVDRISRPSASRPHKTRLV